MQCAMVRHLKDSQTSVHWLFTPETTTNTILRRRQRREDRFERCWHISFEGSVWPTCTETERFERMVEEEMGT